MRRLEVGLIAIAIALTVAGCSSSPDVAATTPRAMAPLSAAAPSTHTPAPTPSATPTAQVAVDEATTQTIDPSPSAPSAAPETPTAPQPEPQPPVDPNAVDPANYPSHAVDTANGGPLPGVEFMTADGTVICGIRDSGPADGFGTCTPSTWATIIPQPGPPMHGVLISANGMSAGYLYPDFFVQPARTIPVLPDGKTLTYNGITCSVSSNTVTCLAQSGRGFTVSTTEATLHN